MIIKLMTKTFITLSLTFGFLINAVLADQVSGQVISFSCNGCHAMNGNKSKPAMSGLNAQTAKELEIKLLDFKYDRKFYSIMGRIAKGYTDQELKAVALYLGNPQ